MVASLACTCRWACDDGEGQHEHHSICRAGLERGGLVGGWRLVSTASRKRAAAGNRGELQELHARWQGNETWNKEFQLNELAPDVHQ